METVTKLGCYEDCYRGSGVCVVMMAKLGCYSDYWGKLYDNQIRLCSDDLGNLCSMVMMTKLDSAPTGEVVWCGNIGKIKMLLG